MKNRWTHDPNHGFCSDRASIGVHRAAKIGNSGFAPRRGLGRRAAYGRRRRMRKLMWWVGVPAAVVAAGTAWVTVFPSKSGAG